MKRITLVLIALTATISSVVAQSSSDYLPMLDISDVSIKSEAKPAKKRVYDYPTNNGIYEGYVYGSDILKAEPLRIEYGSNFLYSMSTKGYNRLFVGYSVPYIMWKAPKGANAEDYPFEQGFHVGYLHASSLSKRIPLFLEYGLNFQYSFGRGIYKEKTPNNVRTHTTNWGSMYSLNVPINVALRLGYQNNTKCVTPYLGINLRYNVGGSITKRERMTVPSHGIEQTDKIALFDKSDDRYAMGKKAFERFQAGVGFGVGYTYNRLYIGLGCVIDAMRIINLSERGEHSWQPSYHIVGRFSTVNISMGVTF